MQHFMIIGIPILCMKLLKNNGEYHKNNIFKHVYRPLLYIEIVQY